MRHTLRRIAWMIAMVLASTAGTLPGCATMGGGMKYALDSPPLQESTARF